jgi:predicted tellurium resistance membrane protein TerC
LTLTVLELVLGIDNIIFIAILSGKLPPTEQNKARTIGLSLTMPTAVITEIERKDHVQQAYLHQDRKQ